ncbi:hypothetical protein Tco_0205341 [Tanacetum coccineum]
MYTFSPMMVANSRKHHCRVRPYTREVLVISTNLDIQKNHYPLDFTNRRGVEARIKNTWYNQGLVNEYKMAEENIPIPTRSDDQLVPVKARLPYGKSNLLLDLQKLQKNPIFRISVDILQNTNFFRAFIASANVPSIYIQQFWNTLTQEAKSGVYSFQLDEQWFPLNADLLREALEITPEEFVQGIQTFFSHRASLSIPSKKSTPHVIPYCRFTKLIIYYLGSRHNIHRRPKSSIHVTGDDFPLGNLKFVPKGEKDEVFGKPIPKELITEAIQTLPYYQQYLDMVARKPTAKRDEQKKTASAADKPKKPTPVKNPAPAIQTKPVIEKSTKPSPVKKADKGKVRKVRKGKSSLQLVDEEEQVHPEPEPQVEDEEYDLQRVEGKGKGIATDEQAALSLLDLHNPKKKTTTDQYVFQRRTPATEDATTGPSAQPEGDTSANIVRDTPPLTDAKTGVDMDKTNSEGDIKILNIGEDQGEDVSNKVNLEEKTAEIDEG